jgi:hypothetical protein
MSTPSPCDELKKREVDVNEITYMGKQYFYNKDEHGLINLFEFKKSLNGYVSVKPGNTAYAPIIEQLTTS